MIIFLKLLELLKSNFNFINLDYTFIIINKIFIISLTCCSFFCFAQTETHLINDEGWAKGNYIEIGISNTGTYGAKTSNKPPNFHLNRESDGNNIFGFIANPQKDNWIDYDGDYFTPGFAEEGFTMEINGINYSNNSNIRNIAYEILGIVTSANNINSTCFDDYVQIIWEGEINDLILKRFYNVTSNGLFIKMTTFIYNESSEIKNNVFFMHNVDPDNNQAISNPYDFKTDLELISQGYTANNISLVKASQPPSFTLDDMDGSHVSFYAQDARSRVTYGGFFNRNASEIWGGQNFTTLEGSFSQEVDEAISIAFNLGNIAPNETKEFTYYYILEDVDENFDPPPIINISFANPSPCETDDGKIFIVGFEPNKAYDINYDFNGSPVMESTYIADGFGNVTLTGLIAGNYANFIVFDEFCQITTDIQLDLISTFNSFSAEVLITSALFSSISTATVIVVGDDTYEFKLDEGEYQPSNIFENIPFGLHKFYIRDNNDCKEIIIEKFLFSYPKYFTPNSDSTNDKWKIKGAQSLMITKILIYNRYGKLLKQLNPNDSGWDGTFNGELLPNTDYWFTISYFDSDNNEKSFSSHFTLKR